MNAILEKSSARIATEYRERLAYVRTLPAETRWQHGHELRRLRLAFTVVRESEAVRSK